MKLEIEAQFTESCQENSDALYRYCYFKVSDQEMAKDLVQETFMRTWNYLIKGQEIDNIKAFFYRTLSNLIIDQYRKKKSFSLDRLSEDGFDVGDNPIEKMEDALDGAQALKLLDQIPPMYKEVIFMKYVEELSIKEIAEILKEPENTISVKIHRGIKKVKEIFDAQDIEE